MSQSRQKICVVAPDADGCVFNPRYIDHPEDENRLVNYNKNFFETVTQQIIEGSFDKVLFIVGSSRQSDEIDIENYVRNHTGSCFPALLKVCEEFQKHLGPAIICETDFYLLADTFGNKPFGENFKKSLAHDEDYDYSRSFFDESKLILLWLHMQKIAVENPNADIVYKFFDDRYSSGPRDILGKLAVFFDANKDLIPRNVKLGLYHYAGEKITPVCDDKLGAKVTKNEIQGEGEIDRDFQASMLRMLKCAMPTFDVSKPSFFDQMYNVMDMLTPDKLRLFKSKRPVDVQPIASPKLVPSAEKKTQIPSKVIIPVEAPLTSSGARKSTPPSTSTRRARIYSFIHEALYITSFVLAFGALGLCIALPFIAVPIIIPIMIGALMVSSLLAALGALATADKGKKPTKGEPGASSPLSMASTGKTFLQMDAKPLAQSSRVVNSLVKRASTQDEPTQLPDRSNFIPSVFRPSPR